MNRESSRSHLIISVMIETTNLQTQSVSRGKLSFVDLAGSERVKKSGSAGDQLKEAQAINKSLSALGNVISALATEQGHVPYRDHKLTMLMSDSIGGTAKTLMFVNVSPVDGNLDETQNSLQYATRVSTIKNNVKQDDNSKEVMNSRRRLTTGRIKQVCQPTRGTMSISSTLKTSSNLENNDTLYLPLSLCLSMRDFLYIRIRFIFVL
eukprot:jgi/Picre1/29128/NNA_004521.t1